MQHRTIHRSQSLAHAGVALALATAPVSNALAGTDGFSRTQASLRFDGLYQPAQDIGDASGAAIQPAPDTDTAATTTNTARVPRDNPAFGQVGHRRLQFQTGPGIGLETEDAIDVALSFDASVFIATDLELAGEVSLWSFFQDGDDALGISTSFVFRYHYINRERWSTYVDVGIGPMFATDNTPDGGTGVNFMPRIGLGLTYALDDRDTRLTTGIRWHHISNARINGETRNPDRDGVFLWAGVSFPF